MKTIDVQDGDTWTSKPSHPWLFQYRNGKNVRVVSEHDHWNPNEAWRHTVEQDIPAYLAEELLKAWGYTLTPAKPEQPDHFGDSNEMVAATVKRLEERVAKLEAATTPAKVRVKAPGEPVYGDDDWKAGVKWESRRWRSALAAAGNIEIVEASK